MLSTNAWNSNSQEGSVVSWYALHTRHQHEKNVARLLASREFNVFLPLYGTVHRWKDRNKQLSLPLFPCYVFIQGGMDHRRDIVTTPGVHGFVGCAGRPAPIPEEEIAAVRQVVEEELRVEPHPFLRCGDWVRVRTGPLSGVEGILIRKKNLFRLVLCVTLLERSVAVEVDVSMVERTARGSPERRAWFPQEGVSLPRWGGVRC